MPATVRAAEDAWNIRDPARVVGAYTAESVWRNRTEFLQHHDETGSWWRSYGKANWAFDAHGYMTRREASINDIAITAAERRLFGPRPSAEHDHTLPLQ